MNFEFLTTFQLTTFVLGIVFSILTIAVVFYTLRHPNGYRSTFLKILFTVIIPFIMFVMWFACVFAAYEILDANELYIMLISLACGVGVVGITIGIAFLINYIVKNKELAKEKDEEIVSEENKEAELEENQAEETVNEKVENEQTSEETESASIEETVESNETNENKIEEEVEEEVEENKEEQNAQ